MDLKIISLSFSPVSTYFLQNKQIYKTQPCHRTLFMLENRLNHFLSIHILVQVTPLTEWPATITKALSNVVQQGERKQEKHNDRYDH